MMMKTTAPESSSTGRLAAASLKGLVFLTMIVFLTLVSAAESSSSVRQESKSRLFLEEGIKPPRRHYLAAVRGRSITADDNRVPPSNWNTVAIPGGRNRDRGDASASSHVVCFQLQRIRHYCPPFPALPPPTPPSGGYEIDPRYGVEKRLVPSGPNPLHN